MIPIFSICAADLGVQALLGKKPTRLYQFGMAPSIPVSPYAVWRQVSGVPAAYLGDRPDVDSFTLQVDVFAKTPEISREVVDVLRDALEPHCYISSWGMEGRDPETELHRINFDIDFIIRR
ncbi:tail completion protein gp17 [Nitrosomonas eutropha]|uniref:Uncharacterized protein DUF3168 n=2 Tax=Nitrosomonas eutropha TaxID=916 RepID=A0ABX5M8W8_9PROT|nr:DUF3168 domain-containing protein [Nitrosomonas eutropha]ABI59710.1 conserved hypothetical protein [Nitrosomonas eutropha C91]PXV82491.1 uncharacterized protein DUF3168 [Nitrosomonas eutropha]